MATSAAYGSSQLGAESEPQLPAYATATVTPDPLTHYTGPRIKPKPLWQPCCSRILHLLCHSRNSCC